jgi:hypothetical protein
VQKREANIMATPKRGGGRKSKYTPETVGKLLQAIKLGATYKLACDYAGIDQSTFHDWMKNKPEFSTQLKEAEGSGAVGLLARIQKEATDGTWQAAAWILERRYPDMYGRQRMEHTGADGNALKIQVVYGDEESGDE